jgi:hypothetical protein
MAFILRKFAEKEAGKIREQKKALELLRHSFGLA